MPNRLGVTGGSGGGLLTNWTITQTQRFKAAVAQRDIADWYGFWFTADFTLFQPTWFRKAPWEDPQDFAARSPITHVANVTTPLMLVLGDAGLPHAAGRWRRDDVPRAEVPEDPDRDGPLPARERTSCRDPASRGTASSASSTSSAGWTSGCRGRRTGRTRRSSGG